MGKAVKTGQDLRRRKFDRSAYDRSTRTHHVGCSQCAALVINGVACHETGCPNARAPRRRIGLGSYQE